MAYKISICGDLNLAGKDAYAVERLTWERYPTEESATEAANNLSTSWHNPDAIWDIISLDYSPELSATEHLSTVYLGFLQKHNLPSLSADEHNLSEMTEEQAAFIRAFITLWDIITINERK